MDDGRDGDRPVVRGPTTNSPSLVVITFSHSVQEPPSPPGPFLFVLLRAKPCRSFRRHAFNDVDGRGSATIGASEPHPHFTRSSAKREKNWRKEGREGFLLFWPRTRASTELFYGRGRAGSGRETGGGDG